MKRVEPEVFVVAETMLRESGVQQYLKSIDAGDWSTDAESDGEYLMEFGGRFCYKSWKPGMNPNVTKVREGNASYLSNIIKQGHGSVLEHGSVTFVFKNVSRVFTHELVRHRVGTGFSQESLRYVRLTDLGLWLPPETLKDLVDWSGSDAVDQCVALIERTFSQLEHVQIQLADLFDMNDPNCKMPMSLKKKVTSMFRRVAPIGLSTAIVFTTNHRNLRHVLSMRTAPGAEEEMRLVFGKVGEYCVDNWPSVYGDFEVKNVDGYDQYVPVHLKV